MIAFTGPVRQVETDPTKAVTIAPAPHAAAIASTGGDVRADHLGVAQMTERGPDQNRARDGPEKDERLAIEPAESDADQAVHEKRAENPRGQVRGRESSARTHR